jgi:tetratricopeptide (TPR) repeat protein
MRRFLAGFAGVLLVVAAATGMVLYTSETNKNKLLHAEQQKSLRETRLEIDKFKEELKTERRKSLDERQKLLNQVNEYSKQKDAAVAEAKKYATSLIDEQELSLIAVEDLTTVRKELAKLKKESREEIAQLKDTLKTRKQGYETRILSLESQLEKARKRLSTEASRFHYNLGVLYAQGEDYDLAVSELKTALGYDDFSTHTHYNLGIIFDDYFKDAENAKYHYRRFLELSPTSDDADPVREWLAALE